MATRRTGDWAGVSKVDLVNLKYQRLQGQGNRLEGHWRQWDTRLAELSLGTYRHMKICCPQCGGLCEGCDTCNESGLCCPTCVGLGRRAKHRKQRASVVMVCPTCQVGDDYNERGVIAAIKQYIDDWFAGRVVDEVESRRREQDRIRAEAEAVKHERHPIWKHG